MSIRRSKKAVESGPSVTEIQYDRYSLIINGRREFIRSGAIHYFRLPSQALWKDRLFKLKAAGYNTVDIYFNWGFHSQEEGQYDFSGIRDIRKLLEIARELGLWVIARPGPYINAEVSGGGFPMWLLAKKDIPLRNRKEGQMVWSDAYMAYVRQWWEQVLPIVNEFDNILMVQIENEYSTLEVEPDYMQALYHLARDLGVKVPLSHNDLFIAGLYEDIVDLYAFDNYSVTQFESDWRKLTGVFSVLDNIETSLRPFCQNRPLIAAELQAGWFGMWKGSRYNDITELLGREHINLSTKAVIAQGLTVFNHYKAIGGTNWGHIGSTETYTSYDFGAPISEVGINTIRLFEAKSLNYFLDSFRLYATDTVSDSSQWPFEIKDPQLLLNVRKNIESDSAGTHWLFVRNLSEQTMQTEIVFKLPGSKTVTVPLEVPSHNCAILPQNFVLDCGITLSYTTAEPIYQNKDYLILKGTVSSQIAFCSEQALTVAKLDVLSFETPSSKTLEGSSGIQLNGRALGDKEISACKISDGQKTLTVLILGSYWADRFWQDSQVLGNRLLLGPETLLQAQSFSSELPIESIFYLDPDGLVTQKPLQGFYTKPVLPELRKWSLNQAATELTNQQCFKKINPAGLDLDSNQQYEGSAWYSLSLGNAKPNELEIDAMHLWAVYLNGYPLSHGHYLSHVNEDLETPLTKVALPKELFKQSDNVIHIFVDSLGHPKGFHDDEQEVQGLLRLAVDGIGIKDTNFALCFSGGLSNEKPLPLEALSETSNSPLVYATVDFTLPPMVGWDVSIGLTLSNIDTERVNIYLNGVLIGRYWDVCKAQSSFYLPEGILDMTPNTVNQLGLLLMDFDMQQNRAAWEKMLENDKMASLHFYKAAPCFPMGISSAES